MFIFPFIYVSAFLTSLFRVLKGKPEQVLVFFILGLPFYITSLSILFSFGAGSWMTFFQSFKELLVLIALGTVVYRLDRRIHFHLIDKLVLAYFLYVCAYIILPIGSYGLYDRLIAVKGIAFFPLVYFLGRLIDINTIIINRFFYMLCGIAVAAAVVSLGEIIPYIHLQTYTGYAEYMFYFFDQDPSGNFGLSWTFEIENGLKRFASFFASPLEHAAATIIFLSVLLALATASTKKMKINTLITITFFCTLLSIFFALSRASFVSYFLVLYAYAVITRKKKILRIFYMVAAAGLFIGLVLIKGDLYEFILNTVTFSNSSSVTHLIEWLDGINAIINYPLGMGLGESGRVSAFLGSHTGGENQFIIIGVQVGIIGLFLYAFIYGALIRHAARAYHNSSGRLKKLSIFIAIVKIGLIIPLLTSEAESYIFISYTTWIFSGLMVNMIQEKNKFIHPAIGQFVHL